MPLSQSEKDLAAAIDFDEVVLEILQEECQPKLQKLLLKQEVYLKDNELSCLNQVLPQHYLDFTQDIYGAYNYAGSLLIEGLSVTVSPEANHRQIFFSLKNLLGSKGYIVVCKNRINFPLKKQSFNRVTSRLFNYLFQLNLEILVFKGKEHLDIIRIYQSNGWNYNVSSRDIINKLKKWQEICKFKFIFVDNSGFSIVFTELPEDIAGFAKEVDEFCPNIQNYQAVIKEIKKSKSLYLSWD
jgi:hypothetical protein